MPRKFTFIPLVWICVALLKAVVLNGDRLGLGRGIPGIRLQGPPPRTPDTVPVLGATECLRGCPLKPISPDPQIPIPSPTKTTSSVTPRHSTKATPAKAAEPIPTTKATPEKLAKTTSFVAPHHSTKATPEKPAKTTSFVTPRHSTKATTTKLTAAFHRVNVQAPFFGWGLPI